MKKKSKDQGNLIVANGGGAQHTGSGDGVVGYTNGSCCGDEVSHGALPAQASKGEIKKRREDSLDEGGVRAAVSPKEERREGEGEVRYGG